MAFVANSWDLYWEQALDQFEPLLKLPYYLSPGWLRIDPTFAPFRGNARFERPTRGVTAPESGTR